LVVESNKIYIFVITNKTYKMKKLNLVIKIIIIILTIVSVISIQTAETKQQIMFSLVSFLCWFGILISKHIFNLIKQ